MRTTLAIAMATLTLTLGLTSRPMNGQIRVGDPPTLETIRMVDPQVGWAVADLRNVSGLLRTTDGGINWRDVTPTSPEGHKIGIGQTTVLSHDVAWVSRVGTFGSNTTEIFRTIDGGRTWKSTTVQALEITSISFINPREGWLLASLGAAAVKESVEIYRSTNGGETWMKVAGVMPYDPDSGLPLHGDKSTIAFADPKTGWITGIDLQANSIYLYVTTDGGRTWRKQNVPLPNGLTPRWEGFAHPPRFFTGQSGTLPISFVLLDNSRREKGVVVFYVTHDGGKTWMLTGPVSFNASEVVLQAVADMEHAWVKNEGVLYSTNNGGRRWMAVHLSSLFGDVTQLDFVSPQVGWAIRRKYPFLLKTLDGGRTWTALKYTILRP